LFPQQFGVKKLNFSSISSDLAIEKSLLLTIPPDIKYDNRLVVIDPKNVISEIRKSNNTVQLR